MPKRKSENENTEQATDKWLRLFDEYCKDTGRRCDLSTVTASDLAYILRHAYVELRPKKAGVKFYSASSLLGFRSAIHRKLVELKRPMNVHSDPVFKDENIASKAFLMKQKKAGEVEAVEHKHPINDDDMSKLSRYFQDLPCINSSCSKEVFLEK